MRAILWAHKPYNREGFAARACQVIRQSDPWELELNDGMMLLLTMERIATDTNNNVESTGVMRNELRVFADIGVARAWLRIIGGSFNFLGHEKSKKRLHGLELQIYIYKKNLSVCLSSVRFPLFIRLCGAGRE